MSEQSVLRTRDLIFMLFVRSDLGRNRFFVYAYCRQKNLARFR